MPIKFRCQHCQQFLGISRAKAGTITDCPTCGRTIRVPHLDGSLAPLPSPKMNLDDSKLRDALGALATLEDEANATVESDPGESDEGDSPHWSSAPNYSDPKLVEVEDVGPAVVAEPITPIPIQEEPQESAEGDKDSADEFAELASLEIVQDNERSPAKGPRFGPLVLLVTVIISLVCGFILGRQTAPRASSASKLNSPVAAAPASEIGKNKQMPDVAGEQDGPLEAGEVPRLFGTLTYVGVSGESRVDKGARVLVVPIEKKGVSKLPANGFRIGSHPADFQVLKTSIRALGGDLVVADKQGEFEVFDLAAGEYGIVLASQYQSRDSDNPTDPTTLNILNEYFEHPGMVLGQVQHHFQRIKIEPNQRVELNYEFPPG